MRDHLFQGSAEASPRRTKSHDSSCVETVNTPSVGETTSKRRTYSKAISPPSRKSDSSAMMVFGVAAIERAPDSDFPLRRIAAAADPDYSVPGARQQDTTG